MLSRVASILILSLCAALAEAEPITITVLPFAAVDGERRSWLGKGIADILSRNLTELDQYRVVDRGQLQAYLREMELQSSAFTNTDQALRVARVTKVAQIVVGSFRVDRGKLNVELALIELGGETITQTLKVSGALDDLQSLLADLIVRLAQGQGINATEDTLSLLLRRPTESLTALEYFYRGMDLQDQGEYEAAVGEFIRAGTIDPRYSEAQLWVGRMFEFLSLDALAISAYEQVAAQFPRAVDGLDAGLLAAQLERRTDAASAARRLQAIAGIRPVRSHTVEASFMLGEALESKADLRAAYEAYAQVLTLSERLEDTHSIRRKPDSRFFPWRAALKRNREANIRMVQIWRDLDLNALDKTAPSPPRGSIVVSSDSPSFVERKYGHTKPLFVNEAPSPNWAEKFYAVIAPPGYTISGVNLGIHGQLTHPGGRHDYTMRVSRFPIPRNYHNSWLGVIYGQTSKPRHLSKHIPFYGADQAILALQFIENHGRIFDWGIDLSLRPDRGIQPRTDTYKNKSRAFHEGILRGRIELHEPAFSGVAKPLSEHWYEARQSLALGPKRAQGLQLVFVKGDLGTSQTDLWGSESSGGRQWTSPVRLGFNSLSDDFLPQLVGAEDGSVRAFWISNRRGLGWELWTSMRNQGTAAWEPALRVPLEAFGVNRSQSDHAPTRLLHYAGIQDRRGQWVLAVAAPKRKTVLILLSVDGETWVQKGAIEAPFAVVNPAIVEDAGGRYRLAAFGTAGRFHLWSSNDLVEWGTRDFELNNYNHISEVAPHRIQLISHSNDELTALISDTKVGLQYARFNPDTDAPIFDLVRRVGLEDYAVSAYDGRYLVARRLNDAIEFREYEHFQTHPGDRKPDRGIIYSEYSQGIAGNDWRRIFARRRVIQPDVTTVGVGADERVWWGIETGAMTLKKSDFFAVDVADGFFHHHVTIITPCGKTTGFASRDLEQPRIGIARRRANGFKFSRRDLPKAKGKVTAMICSSNGVYVVGTSHGHVVAVDGPSIKLLHHFPDEGITALAHGGSDASFLVGTSGGKIARFDPELTELEMDGVTAGSITALTADRHGAIWFGVDGGGVYTGTSGAWWQPMKDFEQAYATVSQIRADPHDGVWMISNPDIRSRGVLYSNAKQHQLLHPIDYELRAPTGLAVSPMGTVWVGTAFDGLFGMARR